MYGYGAQSSGCAAGATSTRPHTPNTVGGAAYTYDNNGNLMSGGGRSYTWTAENLPASITSGTVTENYTYDADNERVAKAAGGATTIYFQGVFEQTVGAGWKQYYSFNGQTVAMRDNAGTVTYLHGDHLGSVSLATNSSGALASRQSFDPWGAVRTGSVGQTGLNYTGQRLDGSGLLYYHARMYDPVLARFVSADSVVPGSASGSLDGIALKPLTVDFHEVGFGATLNGENGQPFWFQLSDDDKQKVGNPWGPANPQALNRYSYVLNGPLKATDPSGHWTLSIGFGGAFFAVLGIRGSVSVAIDGTGNMAVLAGGGGGGYTGAGVNKIGPGVTWTNAPTVDKLAGWSVQFGGQVGEGASVGAEGVFFTDGHKTYGGLSVSGGAALQLPLPFELHASAEHDWLIIQRNLPSDIASLWKKVFGTVPPRSPVTPPTHYACSNGKEGVPC